MKKIICAILILVTLFLNVNAQKDIVRIHIRANSDSEEDQNVKLLVRDRINEYLSPILEKPETKEEAMEILASELDNLKEIAQKTSRMECRVTLGQEKFPQKTYGDKIYPAGEYTALIIEIGSGAGRNWWCVAFPNMCYTTSEKKVEYKSFFIELLERIGVL